MKELALGLGVGSGGVYVPEGSKDVLGIGIEQSRKNLGRWPKTKEGDGFLLADACFPLPFGDKSFDSIQTLFPKGDLLLGLCGYNDSIWPELRRVLKNEGTVEVFTSVSAWGTTWTDFLDRDGFVVVPLPHWRIRLASRSGFESELREIGPEEVKALGTRASYYTLRRMTKPHLPDKAYQIRAWKK